MKMKWWGWLGIAIVLIAANYYKGYCLTSTSGVDVSDGYGLATIGFALSHVTSAVLFLCAGVMIWLSAKQ